MAQLVAHAPPTIELNNNNPNNNNNLIGVAARSTAGNSNRRAHLQITRLPLTGSQLTWLPSYIEYGIY